MQYLTYALCKGKLSLLSTFNFGFQGWISSRFWSYITHLLSPVPLKQSETITRSVLYDFYLVHQFTKLLVDSWFYRILIVVSYTSGHSKAQVLAHYLRENVLVPNHVTLQLFVPKAISTDWQILKETFGCWWWCRYDTDTRSRWYCRWH